MILIQNLAIEVTRKCNLKCEHCLRGDSQKLNIPLVYIDILLNQVYSIGHFCPTGGEPSLNVPAIKYFIDGCKKRHIPIETFYIATNGVKITEDFVEVCKELFDMCKNKSSSSVQISNDIYHGHKYDSTLLKKLPFYSKRCNSLSYNLGDGAKIHREGRMKDNENAKVMSYAKPITSVELFDKNTLYLNVNGDIINGCDWSYENQDFHFLCKVDSIEKFKKEL